MPVGASEELFGAVCDPGRGSGVAREKRSEEMRPASQSSVAGQAAVGPGVEGP